MRRSDTKFRKSRHGILLLAAILAAGCADRDRPFTDVLLEEERERAATRVIQITHPVPEQEYQHIHFTRHPGVRVSFTGQYLKGDRLVALAFNDLDPLTAFFIAEAVVGDQDPPTGFQILVNEVELGNAREVAIILWIEDSQRRRMEGDSVHVRLR